MEELLDVLLTKLGIRGSTSEGETELGEEDASEYPEDEDASEDSESDDRSTLLHECPECGAVFIQASGTICSECNSGELTLLD